MNVAEKIVDHFAHVSKWAVQQTNPPFVMATMLYGSQNYGLDTPESDVDAKTIVVPRLRGLILDKKVSTELRLPDNSLDTVKDVREMFDNYKKGNINFLETLFTPYFYIASDFADEFRELREHRHLIANSKPRATLSMVKGMAHVKGQFMEADHPSAAEAIAKYGYNPKELHHLARLYYFAHSFLENADFYTALKYCDVNSHPSIYQGVISLKTAPVSIKEARDLRDDFLEKIDQIAANADYLPAYVHRNEAKAFLDDLSVKIIRKALDLESKIAAYEMP